MLRNHWKPFDILLPEDGTDSCGSRLSGWLEAGQVMALLIPLSAGEAPAGPGRSVTARVDVIHDPAVLLLPGMLLRGEDGALYRVTGDDSLRRTPPDADEPAALVQAERQVMCL